MKILLLIACLVFSGCALVEKGVVNLLTPNPENKRIEAHAKESETTHQAINEASTTEKVKAHVEVHRMAGKQSHPSFFSSVVSGLYTEEGRRLAGVTVVALGSMIALGLRVASTWGLPGMLASTVKGIQDFKNKYDKDNPIRAELNASLSKRQTGIRGNVAKKVKKILGET